MLNQREAVAAGTTKWHRSFPARRREGRPSLETVPSDSNASEANATTSYWAPQGYSTRPFIDGAAPSIPFPDTGSGVIGDNAESSSVDSQLAEYRDLLDNTSDKNPFKSTMEGFMSEIAKYEESGQPGLDVLKQLMVQFMGLVKPEMTGLAV